MPRTEKYFLGPGLLSDIRQALLRVDAIAPSTSGAVTDVLLDRLPERGRAAPLRYVEWTAEWPATMTATFTFLGSTQTATAVNAFAGAGPGKGWVAKHQGTWHLAVVNLKMQPSYVATDIQLLGHDGENGGILKWYSVTQCGTATAS